MRMTFNLGSIVKSPCGSNCEKRSAKCRIDCDKWKRYEEEKAKEFKIREMKYKQSDALYDRFAQRISSMKKTGGPKLKHGKSYHHRAAGD